MVPVRRLRVGVLLAVALMALVLSACGSSSSSSGGGSPSSGEVQIGLVAETAGFNDRSFNSLALKGLKQAESQLGVGGRALSSATVADYVPNLTSLAREGDNPVIAVGFQMADAVATVAKSFPETDFAIIDVSQSEVAEKPANVLGLVFEQAQASYLAGYLSAEFLKGSGVKYGMIGGEAVPPVQSWMTGYREGIEHANPNAEILSAFSQTFADQAPCKALAENQVDEGAKVIFQIAGGCGFGVYAAVRNDPGVWYVGVDADQSYLGEHVLTSAVKHVENAVFEVAKSAQEGKLKTGTDRRFDLANNGVGLGPVSPKVPAAIVKKVEAVKKEILNGQITPGQ
jgi:basic membrane protein A